MSLNQQHLLCVCVRACARLSVCYNNIGAEGLLSLAAALRVSSTLSHLYIWGNHLEEPVCQVSSAPPAGMLQPRGPDL